jgi:hypothetical protein
MNALSSTINTDFRAVRVTEHHPKDGGAASRGNYDAEKNDKVLVRFKENLLVSNKSASKARCNLRLDFGPVANAGEQFSRCDSV